jgi:hypothetical protein
MTLLDVISKLNHYWSDPSHTVDEVTRKRLAADYAGDAFLVIFAAIPAWLIATIGLQLREGRYFTARALVLEVAIL